MNKPKYNEEDDEYLNRGDIHSASTMQIVVNHVARTHAKVGDGTHEGIVESSDADERFYKSSSQSEAFHISFFAAVRAELSKEIVAA